MTLTRRLLGCVALALGLGLLVAAWSGWQVAQSARELQRAAVELARAQTSLEESEDATASIAAAARSTSSARSHVEDPLVRLIGALPLVGAPVEVVTALSVSTDAAVSDALQPLLSVAGPDAVARLLPGAGKVDLDYAATLAAPSAAAAATLEASEGELLRSPDGSGIARLDAARNELVAELAGLRAVIGEVAVATQLAPLLLGAEAPRRYLLVPQNPAEARGTGGIYGGFVLIEADQGTIRILDSGPNSELPNLGVPVVDLDAEFDEHYGHNGPTLGWSNANLSPHFPDAAQIWSALWERKTGQRLDGVLTLDPVALSYLLEATGPVELEDGTKVNSDNVVQLTLEGVYRRFADDSAARDAFLQEVVSATAEAVLSESVPARPLLTSLSQAVTERRLLFWSPDQAVQQVLGERSLTGRLPEGRPAVGDVIVNAAASKLDYYLERALTYAVGCPGGGSSLTLVLRNGAPASGLPEYVTLPQYRDGFPPGTNESIVTLYAPLEARLGELRQDGKALPYRQGTERGLRWVEVYVRLEPGASSELVLDFAEDTPAGEQVRRVAQPLVQPESFDIQTCR